MWRIVLASLVLVVFQGSSLWAATYWVSKQGSDSNPCFASSTEPKLTTQSRLTIKAGAACLGTGDTLLVKPGYYNEHLVNPLPNGATMRSPNADPSTWFVIQPTNNVVPHCASVIVHSQNRSNITYKYLKWDLSKITSGNKPASFLRTQEKLAAVSVTIEDFEAIGPADGMMCDSGAAFGPGQNGTFVMRRGTIKNIRSSMRATGENPGAHGFYNRGSNGLYEHLWIENTTGACMNFRSDVVPVSNNIFRYNVCKDTQSGGTRGDYGTGGQNNRIHNNVFWNAGGNEARDSAQLFVNNTQYGGSLDRCIRLKGNGHTVRNNIFLNCGGIAIENESSGSLVSHNLTSGNASTIFTDHTKGDFSLKAASPAINGGTSVSGILCSGTCDQGAYEYGLAVAQPSSSNLPTTPPPTPGSLQAIAQ
jgi:hypothetical protein